jgi:hypothetical protein
LNEFHDRLSRLTFLDPACGCGNFLVITYRELRILELEVIRELLGGERLLDVDHYIKVNVDQFYGIEIEEFPAQIAEVAMWLMDHQMNMLVRDKFGEYYTRIPLRKSATIRCANALTTDWGSVVPKSELSYILGNPPFVGFHLMNDSQKNDMKSIFQNEKNTGVLDMVAAWYRKAADYIQGTKIEVAFVSTNSICQGESVAPLWNLMLKKYSVHINFAHQTFRWSNEAHGIAAVYCVIIGFSLHSRKVKRLFLYTSVDGEPTELAANQINAYLVDGPNIIIESRHQPISAVPIMMYGNKPVDGGYLIIENEEFEDFITKEPEAKKYIRQLIGADEYINDLKRYCLWLVEVSPAIIRKMPLVMARVEAVKQFRLSSTKEATRKFAALPTRFIEIRQPDQDYIIVPCHSSENRKYIPIGFIDKNVVTNNAVLIIPDATMFHFGILTSTMHMAWMRYVCGRLKSDYRYSKDIVYNSFPWPTPTDKQREDIEAAARAVLDARAEFPDCSLADLYDPDTMPPELAKAHAKLDRLVERAYGKSFGSDAERVAFLFERYQELTADLFTDTRGKRKKEKRV